LRWQAEYEKISVAKTLGISDRSLFLMYLLTDNTVNLLLHNYDTYITGYSIQNPNYLSCYPISLAFFFLNQKFITWGVRADYGSYFVTTYIKTQTTWREREKK